MDQERECEERGKIEESGRNCVKYIEMTRKNDRERDTRDDRTRGTDVFETSCRSSHAYPKFISTPSLPSVNLPTLPSLSLISLVHFAHTTKRFVIRANLIARRHRWPLTGIELSTVSLPVQGPPRRLQFAHCMEEVTVTL